MTEKEPTKEQIREFWECCGWKWETELTFTELRWQTPEGTLVFDLPPIDLNSLFQYAIPRLLLFRDKNDYYMVIGRWYQILLYHLLEDDPALVLFWVIWEVIHGK